MSEQALSKTNFWSMMFAIFFGNFLAVLSTNMITVALPVLMKEFHAELTGIQWVMTGFILATGTIAPAVGYLSNRFSAKRLYLIAMFGFIASSVLCALAWSSSSLIAFRVLQGSFSGIIMPTTMSIVYQVVPKEQQPFGISIWSLSAMLAPAVGPTLAGWLIYQMDWQWLFWINVPIGLTAVWAIIKYIPKYKVGGSDNLDKLGFAMVISGSLLLLLAFGNGQAWGWLGWKTICCILAGAGIIGWFITRSLKHPYPLLQFKVFRNKRFAYSMLLVSTITISLYSGALVIPLFLQNVQGASTLAAGLVLLPASLLMALIIPFTGRWYIRFGPVKMIGTGLVLIAIGSFALSKLQVDTPHAYIVSWMIFRNVGIALANTPSVNAGMSAVKREWTGYASSINSWLRQGLAALSIGLFSSLLASRTMVYMERMTMEGNADPAMIQMIAYTHSINDINLLGFVITVICIPAVLLLRNPKRNSEEKAAIASAKEHSDTME